jgi:hypothetical protein
MAKKAVRKAKSRPQGKKPSAWQKAVNHRAE